MVSRCGCWETVRRDTSPNLTSTAGREHHPRRVWELVLWRPSLSHWKGSFTTCTSIISSRVQNCWRTWRRMECMHVGQRGRIVEVFRRNWRESTWKKGKTQIMKIVTIHNNIQHTGVNLLLFRRGSYPLQLGSIAKRSLSWPPTASQQTPEQYSVVLKMGHASQCLAPNPSSSTTPTWGE